MNRNDVTNKQTRRGNLLKMYLGTAVSFLLWFVIYCDRLSFRLEVRRTLKKALRENLKHLKPIRAKSSALADIGRSLFWLLAVPLFVLLLVRILGLPSQWFQSSRDLVDKTLIPALTVPIALVGVVIPFLALSVTHVFAKLGFGAIKYAFRQGMIRHLIFTALAMLSVEFSALIAIRFLRTDIVGEGINGALAGWGNVILIVVGWWTVYLIAFAARTIAHVMRSFQPESTLGMLQSELRCESLITLGSEIRRNVALKIIEDHSKSTIWDVSYFQPSETPFVTARRQGVITGISLIGLKLIPWFCKVFVIPDVSKIRIVKPYTFVSKGDAQLATIVYENHTQGHVPPELERLLRAMFRINVERTDEPDTLMEAYDQYEEATLAFVRSDNESLLRKALEGYASVIHDYLATGIRLRAEDYPNMLSDWRPFILMDGSLREVIGLSTTAADGKHVGLVAHWIRSQMDECVDVGDEYIFSRMLSQFLTMHHYAKRVSHTVGLNRAYFEPLQTFDYKLFRFGKTETVNSNVVKYHVTLSILIVKHLVALLKSSIVDGDIIRSKEFIRMLNPSELLGHFHPDLGIEEYEVAIELRRNDLSPDRKVQLEDLSQAHRAVEEFKKKIPQWYQDIQHGAIEYLVDRIMHKASTVGDLKEMMESFLSGLGDIQQTAAWLERYNFGHQVFENRLWEYWPESRRAQSKNPLAAPSFVFALRALLVQKTNSDTITLPPSRTIDGWKQHIDSAVDQLVGLKEWEPILRGADQSVAEKVKSAVDDSVSRYKQQVAESVRKTSLDEQLINSFVSNVKASFEKGLTFPRVFSGVGRRVITEHIITHKVDLNLPPARYPKEAFIEQDRVGYHNWGEQEGSGLSDGVDRYIWIQLAQTIPSSDVVSFQGKIEPHLDNAAGQLSETDKQYAVLVVASHTMLRYEFWDNPKFKPAWQLSGERPADFYGEYLGIPMYEIHMQGTESVLFLDRRDITIWNREELTAIVREFTDKERADILKAQSDTDDNGLREQVFVHVKVAYDLDIVKANRGRLFKPSDPSPEEAT